jgi:hypothetical protein
MQHHQSAVVESHSVGRRALLAAAFLQLQCMPLGHGQQALSRHSGHHVDRRDAALLELAQRYLAERRCDSRPGPPVGGASGITLRCGLAVSVSTLFLIGLIGVLAG